MRRADDHCVYAVKSNVCMSTRKAREFIGDAVVVRFVPRNGPPSHTYSNKSVV